MTHGFDLSNSWTKPIMSHSEQKRAMVSHKCGTYVVHLWKIDKWKSTHAFQAEFKYYHKLI